MGIGSAGNSGLIFAAARHHDRHQFRVILNQNLFFEIESNVT